MSDKHYLEKAIALAKESVAQGGFPAAAIVVKNGEIIGQGISIGNQVNDPTSHGEMASIREACKNIKSSDLSEAVLYASMQPCLMCLGASMWSNVTKIIFACSKERVSTDYYGGNYEPLIINSQLIHPLELIHLIELEEESLNVVHNWEKSLCKLN